MKPNKTPDNIKNMFDSIAKQYDLMNNFISFGMHFLVKKNCVKNLEIKDNSKILDLCCGTGDFCKIIKKYYPNSDIYGADFSENMLNLAKSKNSCISFIQCDATDLPFKNNYFDIVIVGFGLRNILNTEKAVEEIYRVLKPQGKFLHLDFGKKNIFSKVFDYCASIISKLLSTNHWAYSYLIESKKEFPQPDELIEDFESKGFHLVRRQDYCFGVISSQIMRK